MINIVGIGPGSRDYLLPAALDLLEKSDVIIGFSRAIETLNFVKKDKIVIRNFDELEAFLHENKDKSISVAASGDPCFYGVTEYLKRYLPEEEVRITPGLSSFQYLMAKLNKSWQGAFLGSLHGRQQEFICEVKNHYLSVWLTDKKNSPNSICRKLIEENINSLIYIGENLSYEDERIIKGKPQDIIKFHFGELSVVVIENFKEMAGSDCK